MSFEKRENKQEELEIAMNLMEIIDTKDQDTVARALNRMRPDAKQKLAGIVELSNLPEYQI